MEKKLGFGCMRLPMKNGEIKEYYQDRVKDIKEILQENEQNLNKIYTEIIKK